MSVKSWEDLPILAGGHWGQVRAGVESGGRFPAKEFIESLGDSEKAKLMRWVDYLAGTGAISSSEKFKKVEDSDPTLYEFKAYQVRLFGFFHGKGRFVATNGMRKKNDRISKKDRSALERAYKIREETIRQLGR